jgi:hypothetical protein
VGGEQLFGEEAARGHLYKALLGQGKFNKVKAMKRDDLAKGLTTKGAVAGGVEEEAEGGEEAVEGAVEDAVEEEEEMEEREGRKEPAGKGKGRKASGPERPEKKDKKKKSGKKRPNRPRLSPKPKKARR